MILAHAYIGRICVLTIYGKEEKQQQRQPKYE